MESSKYSLVLRQLMVIMVLLPSVVNCRKRNEIATDTAAAYRPPPSTTVDCAQEYCSKTGACSSSECRCAQVVGPSRLEPSHKCVHVYEVTPNHENGAFVTAGVLTADLISFRQGNSHLGQKLMRARVVVQGATVALMVGTAYYYRENPWLSK
ncbi:hypothetical protein FNV43_RR19822 [Rhamnella rubrinervis]|uniref:HIG1 domain-containing protein n=1 Tax=Rhamnella rubrinervis TaxID=2594499 RepID=A0A8K0DZI2_9ROSA|nr:hypothetical protein FNV43_RR19822 [Rhamnella rubrinervis]